MQRKMLWRVGQVMLVVAVFFGGASTAFATNAKSDNFQVIETEFGTTSGLESCSNGICARASIGSTTGVKSSNATNMAVFGEIAADSGPLLEMIVTPGVSDLGELTTEKTSSKTMTVEVRTYLSSGYTLHIMGDPPKYADYALHTSDTPVEALPGTEMFGLNVVANTTPSIGSDPEQVPSVETSFGEAVAGYDTPNLFAYKSGDVVARSETDSGRTKYTISMVVNVSGATPAGHFTSDFSAIVVPIF